MPRKKENKLASKKIKYLTPNQVSNFLAKTKSIRNRAMFSLMYIYGLRCIELTDMTVDDIDFERDKIYIAAAKRGNAGEYYLDKKIRPLLREYLTWRSGQNYNLVDQPLFGSYKTKGFLTTGHVRRIFVSIAKEARIPVEYRHPHVLRHSIAVHMADNGVDVATVQMHLRHRDIKNTMKYFVITNAARDQIQKGALKNISI